MNNRQKDPVVHDEFLLSISPPLITENPGQLSTHQQIKARPSAETSFGLLGNYWQVLQRHKQESRAEKIKEATPVDRQRLSTVEIIRLAGERFIRLQELTNDGLSFSGLSEEELEDVELTLMLLAVAEKVGGRQFDCAARFLTCCLDLSSKRDSPTQRIVISFAEALRERIDEATGKYEAKGLKLCTSNLGWLPCHSQLPLIQITQFTSIQALLDNTATASRIHVIDLSLRNGVQMIVLMQALSQRKEKAVELLKVTAVETTGKEKVEESGRRLASIAKTMGINFCFQLIFLDNIENIHDDLFDIEDGEAVAIYASMVLKTMISQQNSLEKLTNVLRNLNPSVMVVTEIEANHNSRSFVSRFTETLFYFAASFDCLETCLADDAKNRRITEQALCNQVKNILLKEGAERKMRDVKIHVWRAFFARYRMVEIGFSESSLYQARLVVQGFECASFCSIELDAKSLILGWRGTPLLSLSAWKFR